MSKFTYQTYTAVALNATGFASAIAYAAGGYVLTATTPNDKMGHLVTFLNKTATTHVGQNITFTGTDENGNTLTETIVGPAGNATLTTVGHFQTLTSVTASATTGADTFDIGWTADAVGAHIHPELDRVPTINIEVFCMVPSGTPTYAVQYTSDMTPAGLVANSWLTHSTITGKTATFDGQITSAVKALRLRITAAGPVNMTVVEPFMA